MIFRGMALAMGLLLAGALPGDAAPLKPAPTGDVPCAPVGGLNFVCGPRQAEDLIPVPGTRWLLNSGLAPGAGLGAIDMEAKIAYLLYGPDTPKAPDPIYSGCAAPDPETFSAHGIHLHATQPGHYHLWVVSHLPMESLELFDLDARTDTPVLTWKGCLAMPDNARGNSVVEFADGSLLVTVLGGLKTKDGKPTGAVFAWSPRDRTFRRLEQTELVSPNGIELSKDEKEFYVVSTNDRSFHVFSRDGRALRTGETPNVNGDNIRWNGDRLVIAGMTYDEPACGGFRLFGPAGQRFASCHRGYEVGEMDPVTLQWKRIAYGEPNPAFDAIATGAIVGTTLWLSSWKSNGVAYRPLPVFTEH